MDNFVAGQIVEVSRGVHLEKEFLKDIFAIINHFKF